MLRLAKEDLVNWANIYRRIRFFQRMYPLSVLLKDLVLFPLDYFIKDRNITSVRNLTVAITHKCNIRCEMCYFHTELGNRAELPFDIFAKAVNALAPSKPCVILSGGEPFTHPRLLDMAAYVKKKGLALQIFTNGTLCKPDKLEQLSRIGLDYLNVTLLGDEITHDQVAGVPGSYAKLTANLAQFAPKRGNTRVMLNYTITPRSVPAMGHAVDLARRLGLDGIRFQHYNYLRPAEMQAHDKAMQRDFGQGCHANETENQPESLAGMGSAISAFARGLKSRAPGLSVQWAPTLSDAEIETWYGAGPFTTRRTCLYPWRGVLVDADAKLYPCSKIYLELGDLRQNDALSIWNDSDMRAFRKKLQKRLYPACARCCKL